jgi:hypothetical protein
MNFAQAGCPAPFVGGYSGEIFAGFFSATKVRFCWGFCGNLGVRRGFFVDSVWWNAWQRWVADVRFLGVEDYAVFMDLFWGRFFRKDLRAGSFLGASMGLSKLSL